VRVLVPACRDATLLLVPVDRYAKRSTLQVCIGANRFRLRWFVTVSRATAEKNLASHGYDRHNVALASQQNAFPTFCLFELWAETIFFPGVEERRRYFCNEGKAMLLLDGTEVIESLHAVSREPRGGRYRSLTLGWHRRAIALRERGW
jgi:hypothetical protein